MTVYGVVTAAVVGLAAFFSFQSATAGSDIRSNLTLIAPAGAGGGWDTFMREQQQAMRANSLVNNTQVVNIPGAAGTIGLGQLSTMEGQANTLMVTGAGLVAGVAQLDSAVTHDDVRPIARVVEEYDVVVVPADSPYETIDELVEAWRAKPAEVAWTGGGEATQALITGTADAATSGYMDVADQIEAGRLKALGMAAPERLEGVDIPTLTEQGYAVDLANWRAILAPPGITDEEFAELRTLVEESIATPEWQEAIERNKWTEVYLAGDEFDEFLASEQERIAMLVEEIS